MVSAKSTSYADRAKNGRPLTGQTFAKPSPINTSANSTRSAKANDANRLVLTGKSDDDRLAGIPTRAASGVAWANDHSAASSDFATQTTSTTVNGSDSSPSTPATPPSVASTLLSTKPNVWTVRKELMNAVRSAATPPHNVTSPSSNQNLPPTKAQTVTTASDTHSRPSQPSIPAAQSKTKRSAIPSDSSNTQSPATNQAQMTTPSNDHSSSATAAVIKQKANSKSVSTSVHSTPFGSPIPPLDETSSWPAPQEAVLAGTTAARRDSHTNGSEDNKQGPPSHSRESSTVGSTHGKKQHWVRMPPHELLEAVDAAQPPSPHLHGSGRGKRGPDGERRPVGGRHGPGGGGSRSSGRNSKRSSAAPSPTTRPNGLPSLGSATTPTLNANAAPFSSRNFPSQIYGQQGLRSHPHSPMGRSPFLSSHPQSLVNSPRMGGGYGSPRRAYPMQNTLPPNSNHYNRAAIPPPQPSYLVPKPSIRRKAPSQSAALSGALMEVRLTGNSYRPTFGTIEPATQDGMGLGLSVPGAGAGTVSGLAQTPQAALELADDPVRPDEVAREPTEAERILRAEGKFGIGTAGAEAPASGAVQQDTAVVAEQVPAIAVQDENPVPLAGDERPDPKPHWSFGSVDRPAAEPSPTPSDLLVVDPSRRPPYTMPFSDSPGPNGMVNGYGQYDNAGRGSPGYHNRVSPVDGQQQVGYGEGGAPNGYSGYRGYSGGRRPGRGGPRGGYSNRGGYGPRQPMTNANNPGGYYNNGPAIPQQPLQPPQPEYPSHSYNVYYPPPPPPVDFGPYGYSDPYAASPLPPLQTASGGAQPGDTAPYMMMPPYGYSMYPPPPPGMVNPAMGYYYPPPGPQPFYPPPQAIAPGYPLDEPRASILRQVEFYLSFQNMNQDNFLRSRMDHQGWIDVEMIASFNRMRRLTSDINLVREVMNISAMIEVSPDGQKCRMANYAWQMYVAPPQMDGMPQVESQGVQLQYMPDPAIVQQPLEGVQAPQEEQNVTEAAAPTS
ncbi:hypothetical protein FRB90_004088 [Tulasnella sp. 427]|nr:hypothetical protein FRB90_004088 [Tulasnella sp. 427]